MDRRRTKNGGYLGNTNLKAAGELYEWDDEHKAEWIKCAMDPIYFAETYIKVVHPDRGLIPLHMYDYQKDITTKITNNRRVAVLTSRQAGKALSLDTPIPTPNGWVTMGDIKVGDTIFDRNGKETVVTFATDVMRNHDVYEVKFDNGEVIKADAEHLWTVEYFVGAVKTERTVTTEELIPILAKQHRHGQSVRIRLAEAVPYKESALPISPYVLGVWLGDGNKNDGRIHTSTKDFAEISEYIRQDSALKCSESLIRDNRVNNAGRFTIYGLYPLLKEVGVFKNKHIPVEYKFSSIEQRLSLIQGIMDTDGSIDKRGRCEFYQKDENMIDDVREILASLGVKVRKSSKEINGETYYTLRFTSTKYTFARLKRKVNNQRNAKGHIKNSYYYISDIVKCDSVPVRCIQVDNDEHLFLCSKSFIPTHNTTTAVAVILHYILFNSYKSVGILANKGDASKEVLERIKLAYEYLPKWIQQGIEEWNKTSIELENGCKVYAGTTSSSSIRGKTISFLYIDEAAFVEGYDEFFQSVYPTISSGESTKLLLTSTPNGLNHFYKTCNFARKGPQDEKWNGYHFVEVGWREVPGRGEKWYKETLESLDFDQQKFAQEYECVTGDTLIKLKDNVTGEIMDIPIEEAYQLILETQ